MKWFYEWRLKRVRAQIAALDEKTRVRLKDDYTAHSRMRVLENVAASLQKRLAKHEYAGLPQKEETKEAAGDLKRST